MPFQSDSQRRFMYSQHPGIAKRWEKETPDNKDLPERKLQAMESVVKQAPKNKGNENASRKS